VTTVLHVLDHSLPVMSGYSTRSRNIVVFQKAAGLRPVVVTSPKHGPAAVPREERDTIPHYRTSGRQAGRIPIARELALMWRLARRIRDVARVEEARIIHAHSPALNGLPALWVGRRLRIPVVYEARAFWEDAAVDHGTTREGSLRYRVSRALEGFVFRRADAVVTIAQAMRRELIQRGVAADRIRVAPNGVDTEWFRPMERSRAMAARLGLNGGPVIGFIGSFYHYEGLRFLLDAVPALRERVPGVRLLLVGGGEEDGALRSAAVPLGDVVIFAGQVPFAEVREFYSITDVFVCPRRRMRLTELVTPLKPLEAMSMARPVVASNVGGLAELIEHDVTGILVPAESREDLVGALARLAGDAATCARLGASAREAMIRERSWPRLIQRYVDLYASLGGGR
jgi:PEP-CTERM/exosortase A-associated glycosyltransferase